MERCPRALVLDDGCMATDACRLADGGRLLQTDRHHWLSCRVLVQQHLSILMSSGVKRLADPSPSSGDMHVLFVMYAEWTSMYNPSREEAEKDRAAAYSSGVPHGERGTCD